MQSNRRDESINLMPAGHAFMEAGRCLGCHDAPCTQACPVNVDVPGFIRRLRENNLRGAGELIYERCLLGATCGYACPTETLCEGACVLRQAGQPPVRIGALQAFAAMNQAGERISNLPGKPGRVAILGSGPAGLGCGAALRQRGYGVMLFDREERPGGLVERVIPAHRLPAEPFAHDLEMMIRMNLPFTGHTEVDAVLFQNIRKEYDAVFLACGMDSVPPMDFPGRDTHGVVDALDFLSEARAFTLGRGKTPLNGGSVVVLGGGNVALDAAVVSSRLGAEEVIVLYRRSHTEMPGWETEFLEAARLGVEFRWLSNIAEVEQDEGRVSAVTVQRMRFCGETRGGRRWVEADESRPPERIPCGMVILAPGQSVESGWLQASGLELDENGHPRVDPSQFQTNLPGVFAGGELVSGGSTIVASLRQGMDAGASIASHLESEDR